jgi:hypothetical protein
MQDTWRQNCNTLQQTGILKPACSLCLMSTAETGPDQSCVSKHTLNSQHIQPDGRARILFASWPSSPLSCAKFKANSNCQRLPNFVALQISTIFRPVKMYTKSPSPIPASQRKVQFCTLLQVPIRLYGDFRNLKISTATASYEMFLWYNTRIREMFHRLQVHFPKESILNLTDQPTFRNCVDITAF